MVTERTTRLLAQTFTPRYFEHWKRTIGTGNRLEVQALSLARDTLYVSHLLPGRAGDSVARAALKIEKRISFLQEDQLALRHDLNLALTALNQYREWFEKAPVGFHNIDSNGKITDVNIYWLELLGYKKNEVLGKSIFDFVIPSQRLEAQARFDAKMMGTDDLIPEKTTTFRQYVRKDGGLVFVETSDSRMVDANGKAYGMQTSFVDVSSRVAADELRKELARFEKLVFIGEIAQDISHTYKNQIQGIYGIITRLEQLHEKMIKELRAAMLERDFDRIGKVQEAQLQIREQLSTARRQVDEMEKSVRGILYSTTVESEPISVLELKNYLIDVVKTFSSHMREGGLEFNTDFSRLDTDAAISAPESGFKEMLRNLLWNARDAALETDSMHPEVVLEAYNSPGGKVYIQVKDNGRGIEQERLLDIERRLALAQKVETTKGEKGTGLGLRYVGKVMSYAKGEIEIMSNVGVGTSFILSFSPAKKTVDKPALDLDKLPAIDCSRIKVMVIEDESSVSELMVLLLQRKGFQVVSASTKKQALEAMAREMSDVPRIFIVDRQLPDGSGFEVIDVIKDHLRLLKPKIVLSTGYSREQVATYLESYGIEYLAKPFGPKGFDLLLYNLASQVLEETTT